MGSVMKGETTPLILQVAEIYSRFLFFSLLVCLFYFVFPIWLNALQNLQRKCLKSAMYHLLIFSCFLKKALHIPHSGGYNVCIHTCSMVTPASKWKLVQPVAYYWSSMEICLYNVCSLGLRSDL